MAERFSVEDVRRAFIAAVTAEAEMFIDMVSGDAILASDTVEQASKSLIREFADSLAEAYKDDF